MKIGCRWPGGMAVMVPGTNGGPHRVIRLNGPPGSPSVLPDVFTRGTPSRSLAVRSQRAVADTIKRLTDTAHGDYAQREYGVTDVPGDFWNAWYALNSKFPVVTTKMIFSLER